MTKLPSGWAELKNLLNPNFSFLQAAVTAESTTLPGDFDNDGMRSVADIDMLGVEIVAGTDDSTFDLTGDSVVDHTDLTTWLLEAAERNGFSEAYSLRDSNLDGTVNSDDLNSLALNWQQSGAPWSGGDFNADGGISALDLNELALHWRQSIPIASAVSAPVPEPSALLLALFGLARAWRQPRRS